MRRPLRPAPLNPVSPKRWAEASSEVGSGMSFIALRTIPWGSTRKTARNVTGMPGRAVW